MSDDPLDNVQEFHKSNDMALVTFLKCKGYTVQGVKLEGGTCYWFFRVSDGLIDAIDDFSSGDALVEPKEYNRQFSQTKRDMFDLQDARSKHRH